MLGEFAGLLVPGSGGGGLGGSRAEGGGEVVGWGQAGVAGSGVDVSVEGGVESGDLAVDVVSAGDYAAGFLERAAERRGPLVERRDPGFGPVALGGEGGGGLLGGGQVVGVAASLEWPVVVGDHGVGLVEPVAEAVEFLDGHGSLAGDRVELAWQLRRLLVGVVERGEQLFALVKHLAEAVGVEEAGVVEFAVVQLGVAFMGGAVDPVGAEALGEDVAGGLFAAGGEVGVVALGPAGHRHVEVPQVGWFVDDDEGVRDGAALGGVAGAGVGEFDVVSHVGGGEPDGAVGAGGGDGCGRGGCG